MQNFKFQIGKKTIELQAISIDVAHKYALVYARSFGWKGKIKFIN